MCKYEMDPAKIVEDTEQTWFYPQTDRRMDRQTDSRWADSWNKYTTFNFIEVGGGGGDNNEKVGFITMHISETYSTQESFYI